MELQLIINEYTKPLTRPDWKKGCFLCREMGKCVTNNPERLKYIYNVNINYIYQLIQFKNGKNI